MVEGNSREEQMRGRNERRDEKREEVPRGGQILITESSQLSESLAFHKLSQGDSVAQR